MKQISKTEFEADWLCLREPADHAARDRNLLSRAAQCVADGATVLDLGSGTGSTARAFFKAGHDELNWCFLDNDRALLEIARSRHSAAQCVHLSVTQLDDLPLDGVGLVTASALLDLMSEAWLLRLVGRLKERGIPFYSALNFDGFMRWHPAGEHDRAIVSAFNQHQQTDKGVGPALGPRSATVTARIFERSGFRVSTAASPWELGAYDAPLHRELVKGIASAADEIGERRAAAWAAEKQDNIAHLSAEIGHTDILAIPEDAEKNEI